MLKNPLIRSARVDRGDIFSLIGLLLVGAGVYFWFGLGPSLVAVGLPVFLLGFFDRSREVKR